MTNTTIELENVSFAYSAAPVLRSINLAFSNQGLTAILGPSGCGKTTLLRCIAGLEKVSEGRILINKEPLKDFTPNVIDVSMVFQDLALYQTLTVRENIQLALKSRREDRRMIEKITESISGTFEIAKFLDTKVTNLSGGERQRVALARSLVLNPSLLLLDEPFSSLDANIKFHIRQTLKEFLSEKSSTVIMVTHDQDDAFTLADTIVLMKDGIVHQKGKPDDLYFHPINRFVADFVGSPKINIFTVSRIESLAKRNLPTKYIGIRPEKITINDEPSGAKWVLQGKLIERLPKFPLTAYIFETEMGKVNVVSESPGLRIGENFTLSVKESCFIGMND